MTIHKTWRRQSTTSTTTVVQWWYGWGLHLALISHPSRVTKHQAARAKRARSSSSFAEVESRLHPIPVGYLVENVILQDRAEIHYFSQALDCQAIVMDAADYGMVSRPRLWWTRIPWHNVTKHPFTNHPVRWSQHQKLHRLHVGEPHQDPKSIQTEGLQFHQSVLNKQKLVPCFTTPAPSEEG